MSLHPGNGESFHKFYDLWVSEQNQYLNKLVEATKSSCHHEVPVIDKVMEHYEYYYRTKSKWAERDVLAMLSPSWLSSLEEAFLWIGGWRPSMAFHLLYSKCSMQFEAKMHELIQGIKTCDLGDISATQLGEFDELQRRTIREEREISDLLAEHQETVADSPMVELSNLVSEMIRSANQTNHDELEEKIESTLEPKVDGLEKILVRADDLRMRTLQGIVDILTPQQAIDFLIAAAELHLRLHEWGMKKDEEAKRGNSSIRRRVERK